MDHPLSTLGDLKREVADIAGRDPDEFVNGDPLLLEELQLDSLGLAEMVNLLEEQYGMRGRHVDLVTRDWRNVRVSDLYEEICGGL